MFFERKKYDLAFVGLGASNSLIINALFLSNQLQDCKIAVIEPDPKSQNDKTYCFWATPEELKKLQLTNLTDQSWSKLSCMPDQIVDISPLRYYHVSSITLYDHIKQILSHCNVDYYRESLINVEYDDRANLISLHTEGPSFDSIKIFDSRPPQWMERKNHQTSLWQSFLGWKIKTSAPVFDKNIFTMMDFEVDQSDATQFVYILPYADNHALVELTRFGVDVIDHDYARKQLEKFCNEKKWNFTLLEEEKGKIPMCSMDIKKRSVHINHIQTGSGAGKVKPTTGYAFKEMAKDAIQIADNFPMNNSFLKKGNHLSKTGRFAFYDRLLLKILETNPEKGKLIFTSLFAKVDSRLVLKFLEQKTGIKEDISVMMSLPKGLFINQAIRDFKCRLLPIITYLLPFLTTIFFLVLQFMGLDSISNILLLTGLLALGIPHGAMDHILDKKSNEGLFAFVSGYLIKGTAMFLLWKITPVGGLLFFLIYSAWHFGQADFIQWKLGHGFMSFTWGLGMIIFLLFSHSEETVYILAQIFNDYSVVDFFHLYTPKGYTLSLALMLFSLILNRKKWLFISVATMILLSYLPLLQAFGVYFICQHSINGWCQIKERLKKTDLELWSHALPFTLGAVFLFITLFISFDLNWKEQIGSFFIFLSCISLPHVMNMDHFYRR